MTMTSVGYGLETNTIIVSFFSQCLGSIPNIQHIRKTTNPAFDFVDDGVAGDTVCVQLVSENVNCVPISKSVAVGV